MKKILLTSALILSIAGLAPASVLGAENTTQSTSAVKEKQAKDDQKDAIVKENTEPEALPKIDAREAKPKKEGWYQENYHWRFYQDDQPAVNWKQIQGKWYYFDQNGDRLQFTIYKGYAFDQDGIMAEDSWITLNDKRYYASESGKIFQQKWKKIGGVWYYFDKDGVMLNQTIVDGYLLTKSGAMAENGWVKVDQN